MMKLLAIWFFVNRSTANGATEDRLAHLLICWWRTAGSPETAYRQQWQDWLEKESHGESSEVDLVVVIVVVVVAAAVRF